MTYSGVGGDYAWTAKGDTKNRTHFVLQVQGKRFVVDRSSRSMKPASKC